MRNAQKAKSTRFWMREKTRLSYAPPLVACQRDSQTWVRLTVNDQKRTFNHLATLVFFSFLAGIFEQSDFPPSFGRRSSCPIREECKMAKIDKHRHPSLNLQTCIVQVLY